MKTNNNVDSLIRGEISAVESYNQVIAKVKDKAEVTKLETFRAHHEKAVATLKKYAPSEVVYEAQDSGPWGAFVKGFTGVASVFGDKTAIAALKTGEVHGINEYEEALKDETISPELKRVIQTDLLPKQKLHVEAIEAYNV